MSKSSLHRIFWPVVLGALLAGCAAPPAVDTHPANQLYRCDRNGTQEESQAC